MHSVDDYIEELYEEWEMNVPDCSGCSNLGDCVTMSLCVTLGRSQVSVATVNFSGDLPWMCDRFCVEFTSNRQ